MVFREGRQIGYYQWIPFVLLIQAMMFAFPGLLWRMASTQSGINIQSLVELGQSAQNLDSDTQKRTIAVLARNIREVLCIRKSPENMFLFRLTSINRIQSLFLQLRIMTASYWSGNLVTCFYILIKLMYSANVIGQFFLLNAFLKTDEYRFYGVDVLRDLINGREWTETGHFPRVTLCDFDVKYLGNLNRYTVQCALTVNFLNEKLFIFLWWWFFLVAFSTVSSLFFCIFNGFCYAQQSYFVAQLLFATTEQNHLKPDSVPEAFAMVPSSVSFEHFLNDYLKRDGVFIIRMLACHAGDVVATETVRQLWQFYKNNQFSFSTGKTINTFSARINPRTT